MPVAQLAVPMASFRAEWESTGDSDQKLCDVAKDSSEWKRVHYVFNKVGYALSFVGQGQY